VAGCRRIDKKRNTDIVQDLKYSVLQRKINQYQLNYFKHILRMRTYRIHQKIFHYHPKGIRDTGRPPLTWKGQFTKLRDWNRPTGLSLAADDDDIIISVRFKVTTTTIF
jgi:hypothetical protein